MKRKFLTVIATLMFTLFAGVMMISPAAAQETAQGKGDLDKNYMSFFKNPITFHADGSTIGFELSDSNVLKLDYKLGTNGWLGITTSHFMEDWTGFTGLQFEMKGGTMQKIRVEALDANGTSFEKIVVDDAKDGKVVKITFTEMKVRTDYQPPGANVKKPFSLNPIQFISFMPLTGKGVTYFSNCKLYQ